MTQYKILYVDEVEADIHRFQLYVHKNDSEKKFELITLTPENTLNNFMDIIRDEKFDAIITDHKLHEENSNINFDGIDLVREIFKEKPNFPCFVLTSYDEEAVENGDDVNIVYIKGLMDTDGESKAHATFLRKIENQIKHYIKKIEDAQSELLELVNIENEKTLNAHQEARLLELDNFIEKSTNNSSSIPGHLKSTKNLDELHKMINSTDKLLEELKKFD